MRTHLPAVAAGIMLCIGYAPSINHVGASEATSVERQRARDTRLSFHNRLLLNRVILERRPTIEIMLALARHTSPSAMATTVTRLGGRILRSDDAVGYVRVEIPTARFSELVTRSDIDTFQISSLSQGAWYRDAPPQRNAEMFRGFETLRAPAAARLADKPSVPSIPALTAEQARGAGYTAAEDAGVAEWLQKHPLADGRGVTIAILESAQLDFEHASTSTARALDGRELPKIAGIVNTIGPGSPDATRVELTTRVEATTPWTRIGGRTYILPRPGRYRFGSFTVPAGSNLVQQFGVIEDERTGEIWVDTNGDGDFSNTTSIRDANESVDARRLTGLHPGNDNASFVLTRGRFPHTIHIYLARDGHQAMTLSVAAGARTGDGLAAGVAPGARVVLVRKSSGASRLDEYIESYLEIARRPDVDILCDSTAIQVVPDTAADFVAVIFNRLLAAYGKPIFHGAGNSSLRLASATTDGDVFSVGGTLGPRTFAAFYGGAELPDLIVHPTSAAGPSLDGSIKPDFLAPMHVIAADVPGGLRNGVIPVASPEWQLPEGHQISCCTSASGPYAAGLAALLISRARLQGLPHSLPTLSRALRLGARFLANAAAHEQGNGVLNVEGAWREMQDQRQRPRITSSARIIAPMAAYATRGDSGSAIFERDGWFVGRIDTRMMTLRRHTGDAQPITCTIAWTGNDGTFSAPATVTLPLGRDVALPIAIAPSTVGAHSALLNLLDPADGSILFRTQATIVAAARFDGVERPLTLRDTVPFLRYRASYVSIPEGVETLTADLVVERGPLRSTILRSHTLSSNYFDDVNPSPARVFGPGTYSLVIPRPEPGTWTFGFGNDTARRDSPQTVVSTMDAEYTLTLRLFAADLHVQDVGSDKLAAVVSNRGTPLQLPALDVSSATRRTLRTELHTDGVPNQVPIEIPRGTQSLTLNVEADLPGTSVELFLYDCTTGQCFSYSFAVPPAQRQRLTVRAPRVGRWIAAINGGPVLGTRGSFTLEAIVTSGKPIRIVSPSAQQDGAKSWMFHLPTIEHVRTPDGAAPVLQIELTDLALERQASQHPWDLPERARAATLGTGIYVLK